MNVRVVYFKVTLSAFFWGANFILAEHLLKDLPPLWAAVYRFTLGVLIMMVITLWRGEDLVHPVRRHFSRYLLLAAVGIMGFNLLFFFAMQSTSPVNAALIMATNPLLTTIIAAIVLGERPLWRHYAALPMALVGVAIVISNGRIVQFVNFQFVIGDVLMLGANLAWAMFNVLSRRFMPSESALSNTTLIMVCGALLLGIAAFSSGEYFATPGFEASLALLMMVIGGTVLAYLFWMTGIKQLGAARTSLFLNLVPVFTLLLGALLGSLPSQIQLIGAILVISSVTLAMLPQQIITAK